MHCGYQHCTGVHDNNRYHELCEVALSRKRDKDRKYSSSTKGILRDCRTHTGSARLALAAISHMTFKFGDSDALD